MVDRALVKNFSSGSEFKSLLGRVFLYRGKQLFVMNLEQNSDYHGETH